MNRFTRRSALGLFVALAFVVANHAVAHQVGHQLEQALIALFRLGQLGDTVDDVVVTLAREAADKHLVARCAPGLTRPVQLLHWGQFSKIRLHVMLQKVNSLVGT